MSSNVAEQVADQAEPTSTAEAAESLAPAVTEVGTPRPGDERAGLRTALAEKHATYIRIEKLRPRPTAP